VVEQAFNALEPGGWFESQEVDCNVCSDDHTLDPDGPVVAWSNDLIAASVMLNRPAIVGVHLKEMFERVGFVDVQQHRFKMPINGWPKDSHLKQIGYMWGTNVLEGLAAFSYQLFNKAFERTSAQIEVSCSTHRYADKADSIHRCRSLMFDAISSIRASTATCPPTSSLEGSHFPTKSGFLKLIYGHGYKFGKGRREDAHAQVMHLRNVCLDAKRKKAKKKGQQAQGEKGILVSSG
jgi:hypothetical protein